MPDNNKKFDNRQVMERQFPHTNHILRSKAGSPDHSHKGKNGSVRESSNDNSGFVFSANDNSFFGDTPTIILKALKEQEMATVKIGWLLFNFFGFGLTTYVGLIAYIEGDAFKGWVLFFFGLVFMVIECLRRYEGYRSRKIDNDERLYGIKKSHKQDHEDD